MSCERSGETPMVQREQAEAKTGAGRASEMRVWIGAAALVAMIGVLMALGYPRIVFL